MGSGIRGNFGNTKGATSFAATKSNHTIVIKTIRGASKEIKNIASNAPLSIPNTARYEIQNKNGYKQVKMIFDKDINFYFYA